MEGPDPRNLIVNYIPTPVTDADLRKLFEPFGEIETARVIVDKNTGHPKGYGFVKFTNEDCAQKAMAQMNGHMLNNKRLKVTPAKGPTASLGLPSTNATPAPAAAAPATMPAQQTPTVMPMNAPMGMGMGMGMGMAMPTMANMANVGMMGMMPMAGNPLNMGMQAMPMQGHPMAMQPMGMINQGMKPQQQMMPQSYAQFMPTMNGFAQPMMMSGFPTLMPGTFQGYMPMGTMGTVGMTGLGMAPMVNQNPFATTQQVMQGPIMSDNQLPTFQVSPVASRDANPATATGYASFANGTQTFIGGISSGVGSQNGTPMGSLDAKSSMR